MKISIDKNVLFKLISSHSRLAQAEYNRNPAYNSSHFSAVAEDAIIAELQSIGILDECMEFLTRQ
jgi:hypothetical protein